jgi:hypothetical protein
VDAAAEGGDAGLAMLVEHCDQLAKLRVLPDKFLNLEVAGDRVAPPR